MFAKGLRALIPGKVYKGMVRMNENDVVYAAEGLKMFGVRSHVS